MKSDLRATTGRQQEYNNLSSVADEAGTNWAKGYVEQCCGTRASRETFV